MLLFVICATFITFMSADSHQPSPQQPAKGDKQAKVQGCVSEANAIFNLTDSSGTIYRLAGDASKFTEHNGHRVEVTGAITPSTSSQTDSQPTITVSSVQHIASTCNASQERF